MLCGDPDGKEILQSGSVYTGSWLQYSRKEHNTVQQLEANTILLNKKINNAHTLMMSFGYKTIKNKTASMRSQLRQCNGSGPRGVFPEAEVRFAHPPVTLTFSFSSVITEWKPNWMLSDMRWLDTGNVRDRCFTLTAFPTQAKHSTLSLQDLTAGGWTIIPESSMSARVPSFSFSRIMWKIPEQGPVLLTDQ